MAFLKWLIPLFIDRALKFFYEKLMTFIKKEKAKKATAEQIAKEESAKAEKLKAAQTKKEIEDAAKDSIGHL